MVYSQAQIIAIARSKGQPQEVSDSKLCIANARKNEAMINALCSREYNQSLIYGWLQKILTADKYASFVEEYKNYTQPLINQIQTHFSKIFSPTDSKTQILFQENANDRIYNSVAFQKDVRKHLFSGTSDINFFTSYAIDKLIKEPNSSIFVFLNDLGKPEARCYSLDYLYAYTQVYGDLTSVVYKKKTGGGNTMFFGGDQEKTFYLTLDKKLESVVEYKEISHKSLGLSEVPFMWLADGNANKEDGIKKSLIQDIINLLGLYCIFENAKNQYKMSSAYPLQGFAEDSQDSIVKQRGNPPSLSENDYATPQNYNNKAQKKVNPTKLGATASIPILKTGAQAPEVEAFVKAHFRVESDSDILTFHADDSVKMKNEILNNAIGQGFTSMMTNQAINDAQVTANFDDIETNLADVASSVEKVWSKLLRVSGEMYASNFMDADVNLGRQYLFKNLGQLLGELEKMNQAQMPKVDIVRKQKEIRASQYKSNKMELAKVEFVSMFQPFKAYTQEYIIQNKELLAQVQPLDYILYINFDRIVDEYKVLYGDIPIPTTVLEKRQAYTLIKERFYDLANQILASNQGTSINTIKTTTW